MFTINSGLISLCLYFVSTKEIKARLELCPIIICNCVCVWMMVGWISCTQPVYLLETMLSCYAVGLTRVSICFCVYANGCRMFVDLVCLRVGTIE
jgi:hypothetical protein